MFDIKEMDTAAVCRYIDEIAENGDLVRAALSEKAAELREKAEQNADLCISLLQEAENRKK